MMTPNDIEVLLHYHCCPRLHDRDYAPAVKESTEKLIHAEMIQPCGGYYKTTSGGKMLVAMLCSTPFPVNQWIDPRTMK